MAMGFICLECGHRYIMGDLPDPDMPEEEYFEGQPHCPVCREKWLVKREEEEGE